MPPTTPSTIMTVLPLSPQSSLHLWLQQLSPWKQCKSLEQQPLVSLSTHSLLQQNSSKKELQLASEVQLWSLTAANEKPIWTKKARLLTEITATAIPRSIVTRCVLSTEQKLQVFYSSGAFSVVLQWTRTSVILQDIKIKLHGEA